jgi:hypothetical protein
LRWQTQPKSATGSLSFLPKVANRNGEDFVATRVSKNSSNARAGKQKPGAAWNGHRAKRNSMQVIAGTKIRAIENYESKKEKWLVQVAADPNLSRAGLRVAIGIGLHMNRKQHMLAWPGLGRLAKILCVNRSTVVRGVKDLEVSGHMRVVRSRNGAKNNANHYHMNIWRTGGGATAAPGGAAYDTRVVRHMTPEPMNEPMKEPLIRKISGGNKIGGRGSGTNPLAQPKPPWTTPRLEEITGTAEGDILMQLYAAPPGLFRPVISRFDRARRSGDRTEV